MCYTIANCLFCCVIGKNLYTNEYVAIKLASISYGFHLA